MGLGPKFGLPVTKNEIPIPNIIKDLEACINAQDSTEGEKNILRAQTTNILTNHYRKGDPISQRTILKKANATKKFIKEHPELMISRSDKGNSTVIMLKDQYHEKVNEMLNDTNTYEKINRDPTSKFQKLANDLFAQLNNEGLITKQQLTRFKCHNAVSPKLYCLRKTHKDGLHLRPVVSCVSSPGYNIAKYLHSVLNPITTTFHYNICDSFHLVETIKNLKVPDDYVLVSLDVVSLFTNIPKNLVINIIEESYKYISNYTDISKSTLIQLIRYCFETSYFSYNNTIYLQKDGSAMGNPASPVLANLVMNHLFNKVVKTLPFNIPFLFVYVDDTVLAAPKGQLDLLLNSFNSFHPSLRFTMETENNNKISFLDTELHHQNDGSILINWYSKSTNSGRLLNFHSNHPISNKVGIVNGLLHRAVKLSSPQFHHDNINRVKTLLKNNNYPSNFINRNISKFMSKTPPITKPNFKYFRFPFIDGLSQKINKCFKNNDTKLAFYNPKTTNIFFTPLKDKIPPDKKSNIIYKIPCQCDKTYVGQTKQYLQSRLQQHRNDCKNTRQVATEKTALAQHHFDTGHRFLFEKAEIVDTEHNYPKRLIGEMIHITLNETVNLRTDTKGLSTTYNYILSLYKQNHS